MRNCPFCNQPMQRQGLAEAAEADPDFYICGACQVEQALYWQYGEVFDAPEGLEQRELEKG